MGRFDDVKQGDLAGKGRCSLPLIRVRRAGPSGVRAPIVAWKPGNAGGAKGCRKMDA